MEEKRFNVLLILQLSSFHIGSAMCDILLATVWNRVMIADLGYPATVVGFLLALRYFLSPLAIWAGFRSDQKPLWGLKRTPYIWLGRGLMVLALPLLGGAMMRLVQTPEDGLGWIMTFLCFLLFGGGTLISGSPFLALVRDSAPVEKQGLAVSVVLTALVIFFPISAVIYSRWIPAFNLLDFEQVVFGTAFISGFFWFISIVGVEKRQGTAMMMANMPAQTEFPRFLQTLRFIWEDQRTRRFLLFFIIATTAAWLQDTILEPFGKNIFGLDVAGTTNFNRIWLGMTAVTLIGSNILLRNHPSEKQDQVAIWGLGVMAAGMGMLTIGTVVEQLRWVQFGLAVFGAGFGVYSFGGFNLIAVMTTVAQGGMYLGVWTVIELLFKGLATFLGGALRDLFFAWTGSFQISYSLIYGLECLGLVGAALILAQVDVLSWAREMGRVGKSEPVSIGVEL